jgi:hypothetical protein
MGIFDLLMLPVMLEMIVHVVKLILRHRRFRRLWIRLCHRQSGQRDRHRKSENNFLHYQLHKYSVVQTRERCV